MSKTSKHDRCQCKGTVQYYVIMTDVSVKAHVIMTDVSVKALYSTMSSWQMSV